MTRTRALAALLTLLTTLVLGLVGTAAPAQAYPDPCRPDAQCSGSLDIPDWIRCPQCPIEAISFEDVSLPPQDWTRFVGRVHDGLRDLGEAAAAKDADAAKAWRDAATADFSAAALLLGGRPLRFGGVWVAGDGELIFVPWWVWEQSLAWSFIAGQDLAAGLNLLNGVGPPPGSEQGSLLPPIQQPPIAYFQDMHLRLSVGA